MRLIRAFSLRTTVWAAVLLTAATAPLTLAYSLLLRNSLAWLPAAIALTGAIGFVIALRVLRFRRQRSAVVAAFGIGLLAAPWGAFLIRPPY